MSDHCVVVPLSMGNACAGCLFFTVVEPLAKTGKGTAHIKTYSVRETKRDLEREIKSAKRNGSTSTFSEFASQSYPEEVIKEAVMYYAQKGYNIHTTNLGRCTRVEIMWN